LEVVERRGILTVVEVTACRRPSFVSRQKKQKFTACFKSGLSTTPAAATIPPAACPAGFASGKSSFGQRSRGRESGRI